MTGAIMQLVGKGAQDNLVVGNPSFTHFRSVYKRHTDFAMEHFKLVFRTTNLNLPLGGSLTLRAKVERYAQLLHDCYLCVTLPNIYSPVVPLTAEVPHPTINYNSNAIGYEFQWVKNIGYNMIKRVSLIVNGQELVRHTGEWMKLYAATKFDANKKAIVDEMVGNVPELYDPANAYDRSNQYPHAISTNTSLAEPSIPGRNLIIPLHFWFCEHIGAALPLIAMQYSEVEIVVELRSIYELFTVLDVDESHYGTTFGTRIACDSSSVLYKMSHFLSPPTFENPMAPVNPDLVTWNLNPFIEADYIFLTDAELVHIAKTEHAFIFTQVDMKGLEGQYGPSNDLDLPMRNLCTRIVWVAQRNDRAANNDYDNYTNWVDPNKPPLDSTNLVFMTPWYTSGLAAGTNISTRDILLESSVILDGKERFGNKDSNFFSLLQNYKHHTGRSVSDIPGVYAYSFSLDHNGVQPTGHINGSMFNRTILRNTYVQPPYAPNPNPTIVCVLKSTASNPNPTVVNPNAVDDAGNPLYGPNDLLTVVRKSDAQTLAYTYNVRAFVETYNFLRVQGGMANVVFSS